MKKENSTWTDILKPVVVLTVICIVVSGILAFANSVTAPIIASNAEKAANRAKAELLEADEYEVIESDMEGVSEVCVAKDSSGKELGYIITAFGKGYGGDVVYMTAFDNDGKITNLTILSQEETAGLGSRITEPEFYTQFVGKTEELTSSNVNMISGATISSTASINALNNARKAFNQYAKGIVEVELTLEEKIGLLYGEGSPAATLTEEYTHADALAFYKSDAVDGAIIIETEGKGNGIIGDEHVTGETLKAYVAFDGTGTIVGVYYDTSSETEGLGTKINEEPFVSAFNGKTGTDGVDTLAGATYSSKGAIEAVGKAVAVYSELFS